MIDEPGSLKILRSEISSEAARIFPSILPLLLWLQDSNWFSHEYQFHSLIILI